MSTTTRTDHPYRGFVIRHERMGHWNVLSEDLDQWFGGAATRDEAERRVDNIIERREHTANVKRCSFMLLDKRRAILNPKADWKTAGEIAGNELRSGCFVCLDPLGVGDERTFGAVTVIRMA